MYLIIGSILLSLGFIMLACMRYFQAPMTDYDLMKEKKRDYDLWMKKKKQDYDLMKKKKRREKPLMSYRSLGYNNRCFSCNTRFNIFDRWLWFSVLKVDEDLRPPKEQKPGGRRINVINVA